jgi:hypothetical protein
MGAFNRKMGRVYFEDARGAIAKFTLGPTVGDFSCDGLEEGQYEAVVVEDRDEFLELIPGKQTYPTWKLTLYQDGSLTAADNFKALDAILGTGKFAPDAGGTTTDPGGLVWCGKITWSATRQGVTAGQVLPNCRNKAGFAEAADKNGISISGTCYARPSYT